MQDWVGRGKVYLLRVLFGQNGDRRRDGWMVGGGLTWSGLLSVQYGALRGVCLGDGMLAKRDGSLAFFFGWGDAAVGKRQEAHVCGWKSKI